MLVEADDVFDPEVLSAIDRLGKRLEAEVPFADEVTSLMRLTVSQGTEEGIEVSNPFKDGILKSTSWRLEIFQPMIFLEK